MGIHLLITKATEEGNILVKVAKKLLSECEFEAPFSLHKTHDWSMTESKDFDFKQISCDLIFKVPDLGSHTLRGHQAYAYFKGEMHVWFDGIGRIERDHLTILVAMDNGMDREKVSAGHFSTKTFKEAQNMIDAEVFKVAKKAIKRIVSSEFPAGIQKEV